jgi:hypothetical protein
VRPPADRRRAHGHRLVQNPVPDWPFLLARHSGKGVTIASESLLDHAQAIQWALGFDGDGSLHSSDWQFQ